LENTLPSGGGISANVIWGKKYEKEKRKAENVEEKRRNGKEKQERGKKREERGKKMRKGEVKG
jgi:hypothetical protein